MSFTDSACSQSLTDEPLYVRYVEPVIYLTSCRINWARELLINALKGDMLQTLKKRYPDKVYL